MSNESRSGNCLTQDLLIGLLYDSLPKNEQLRAAEHVQICTICQKELETICEQRKIELPESTSDENDPSQDSVAEWSGKLAQRLMAELQQDGSSATSPEPVDPPSMATIISTEEEPSATEQTVERGAVDSETSVTKQHVSGSNSPTELHIAEMFGRYKVEKILGQGAMGAVYLARDTQLDRDVALKIPKFGSGNNVDDQELLERFYREARAAATLRSPHICPVYDVGEINGQHYITMAYIEGRPLKDFTKSKKKHSEKQIATTVRKLAQGLAEAHEIGVVHRDLKPANVMVDRKGEPVVMDFGLARRSSSDDVQVTQSGAIMGTPAYMSPEQVEGDQDKIGPQADIYALGIIMYELITGEMPYKGSLMSILQQIALNNPEKPSKLRSDLDPRLEQICLKMMAGDLAKRYHTMEEVAADLQEVMRTPRNKSKQQTSANPSPKQTSIPTATEESNPALISIAPQSITEQLREKRGAASKSKRKTSSGSSSSVVNKNLLIGGGVIGLLLLMGIVFLVRVGKYDVQITLDDPSITLSVDDNKLNIKDGKNVIQLSAGPHKLQLEKDGLKTQVEEFTVTKDGKTALTATIVNGKLDALLGGESIPSTNGRSVVTNQPSGSKKQLVSKPADYDNLATGTWKSLSGSKEIVVDNNNPGSQYGAGFKWFPETVGRDVLARANVKMTTAVGVGIHVRTAPNEPREFSYVGDFNREQTSSGIAVINPDYHALGNKQYFNDAVYDQQFFEIAVAAVGDRVSVYIDGRKMAEATDQTLKEGYIGLTAFAGSAIFKDVEVMYLDKSSELTPSGNYALQFTNPSSRVDFDFDIDLDEDFTVELWVSMTEPPTSEVQYPRVWGISRHVAITLAQPPRAEHPCYQVGCNFDPNFWITHSTHPDAAPLKTPVHLAVVKHNSKHYFFFNGRKTSHTFRNERTEEYQKLTAMAPRNMTLGDLSAITGSATGSSFTGLIHSMRLSRGRRYSSSENFTPPTQLKSDHDTLALYEIEEGSGTTLKDSSGNGYDGKIIGAKWVKVGGDATSEPQVVETSTYPGKFALSFPKREASYVEVATLDSQLMDSLFRDKKTNLTIEFWLKRDQNKISPHDHYAGWSDSYLFVRSAAGSEYVEGGEWGGRGAPPVSFYDTVAPTRTLKNEAVWTHVAAVLIKPTEYRLFIDGKLVDTKPAEWGWPGSVDPFQLMAQAAGMVGETRVSTTARYDKDFTPDFGFKPDEHTLALYHFDEGTGDILKDSSGNGHHGKIIGAKWVPANVDSASGPDTVNTRSAAVLKLSPGEGVKLESLVDETDSLTMEFWLQLDQSMAHVYLLGPSRDYCLRTGSTGQIALKGVKSSVPNRYELGDPAKFPTARFVHVAMVRDAETQQHRLYVDGTLSESVDKIVSPLRDHFQIGGTERQYNFQAGLGFDGLIDEIRISSSARYSGESFSPQLRFEPDENTLALYHCDEIKDGLLLDSSGNNHHGKVIGATIRSIKFDLPTRVHKGPPPSVSSSEAPPTAIAPFDAVEAEQHQKAWANYLGEPVVTTNSIGMQLAVIPPGEFKMGEGENVVDVTLTKPFRIGVHEVTQGQWRAVMETEPWKGTPIVLEDANVPATYVTWMHAVEYCRKLTDSERESGKLLDGWEYRLPTETEWEWACRSGTMTSFSFGDDEQQLEEYAFYKSNANDTVERYAHAVGLKKPNPWGLFDMHGNVWERCSDWHGDALPGGTNPTGPTEGSSRVRRGGSWLDSVQNCRSASRFGLEPSDLGAHVGFRVVLGPT